MKEDLKQKNQPEKHLSSELYNVTLFDDDIQVLYIKKIIKQRYIV